MTHQYIDFHLEYLFLFSNVHVLLFITFARKKEKKYKTQKMKSTTLLKGKHLLFLQLHPSSSKLVKWYNPQLIQSIESIIIFSNMDVYFMHKECLHRVYV